MRYDSTISIERVYRCNLAHHQNYFEWQEVIKTAMVLCKFFLQGTCRFGSKCANEHIDIKQIVKADVESALTGKQWPISNFGPFKDKPCLPNFIQDLSFEEVRWLCYDAKQKNCLEQYVQQFTKEAIDAKNKMNALLQMTPQVVEMVCCLYDTPLDNSNGAVATKANNPFGMSSNADAGSIFAKSTPTTGSNNIFGTTFSSPNNSGSLFGGGASTTTGGLFGGNNTAFGNQQQTSLFGQQMAKPAGSFFGGSNNQSIFSQTQTGSVSAGGLFSQAAKTSNGLFGQAVQQQQPIVGGSLFGQVAQQQQQPQGTGNGGLFGQTSQTQSVAAGNLFTQAMQQQAQPVAVGSLFGQAMQQQTQPVATGNLFAQSMQQQSQPTTGFGLFSQAAKPAAPGFGQQNTFGQPAQPQQTTNFFGHVPTPAQPASGGNSFAQGQPTIAANTGMFGSSGISNPPQTQNVYGQTVGQQPTNNPMFGQQPQPTAPAPQTTGFFQSALPTQQDAQPNSTPFGQNAIGTVCGQPLLQSPVISSSVYSKMEELSAEDIEAFKADFFVPGKIPNVPPPRELIN